MKKLTKQQKGFTIIEVLIVLAIAGLILLIVFLAVPALQRNSRNTQRKDDVAKIIGAVNEWQNNHNGTLPTSSNDQNAAIENANLGIYDGAVTWGTGWPSDENAVVIISNAKCTSEDATSPQNRSIAVTYNVETTGAQQAQCDGS